MDEDHAGHRLFFLCTQCAFCYFDLFPEHDDPRAEIVLLLLIRHAEHPGVLACSCKTVAVSAELLLDPLAPPAVTAMSDLPLIN